MVQWLKLHAANVENVGLISGRAAKIPHAINTQRSKSDSKEEKKSQNILLTAAAVVGPTVILSCLLPHSIYTWDEKSETLTISASSGRYTSPDLKTC